MLRISQTKSAGTVRDIFIEGRIVGPWVEELRKVCESALPAGGTGDPLRIHLAHVAFMDAAGTYLLGRLQSRGVVLVNAPPFLVEQLKSGASSSCGLDSARDASLDV